MSSSHEGRFRPLRLLPMAALLGILIGGSIAQAASVPLFSSADEVGHFDYAYQVWHGHLPDFYQGVVVDQLKGSRMPVQWVSQHPPLFYLIMAPIVGPLTDAGHILIAGTLARAVNTLLGCVVIMAVVWAVRRAAPARPHLAYGAGLVAASASWMHGVSGAVYNDTLTALLAALMLGLTVDVIRNGPGRAFWLKLLVTVCAAGLTRLSLLAVALACLTAIAIEGLVRGGRRDRWGRWSSLVRAFAVGLGVLATSGWFYLRNLRLSGSITGGHPEWSAEHLGRTPHSIANLIAEPSTWIKLLGLFGNTDDNRTAAFVSLMVVPVVIALAMACVAVLRRSVTAAGVLVVCFLMAVVLAVSAMQLMYTSGGGGLIPRYALPLLVPISAAIAAGLGSGGRVSIILVPIWTLAAAAVRLVGAPAAPVAADNSQVYGSVSHVGMALCLVSMGAAAHCLVMAASAPTRPLFQSQETSRG